MELILDFCNKFLLVILPTRSKSSFHNLVINRNDGYCRSFPEVDQVNFSHTIVTWDPVYGILWRYFSFVLWPCNQRQSTRGSYSLDIVFSTSEMLLYHHFFLKIPQNWLKKKIGNQHWNTCELNNHYFLPAVCARQHRQCADTMCSPPVWWILPSVIRSCPNWTNWIVRKRPISSVRRSLFRWRRPPESRRSKPHSTSSAVSKRWLDVSRYSK